MGRTPSHIKALALLLENGADPNAVSEVTTPAVRYDILHLLQASHFQQTHSKLRVF